MSGSPGEATGGSNNAGGEGGGSGFFGGVGEGGNPPEGGGEAGAKGNEPGDDKGGEAGAKGGEAGAKGGEAGEKGGEPGRPGEGSGGNQFDFNTFKEQLPEDIKNDPSLQVIHDMNALAKSYVNAQKQIGADKVPIPSKHATEEEWNAFYQKLGRPESADGYDIQVPKDSYLDDDAVGKLKQTALEAGLNPTQAQKMAEFIDSRDAEVHNSSMAQMQEDAKEQAAQLRKEWGNAFQKKVKAAEYAAKVFGGDDFIEHLKKTGASNDARVVKMLATVADKMFAEGSIPGQGEGGLAVTPKEAERKIQTIMGNKDHPYFNKDHPNHANAVQEVQDLYKAMSPT